MKGGDFVGWAFINNWQLIAWNTQTGKKETLVAPFQVEHAPPLFIGSLKLGEIDAIVVSWPHESKVHLWRCGYWREPILTWNRPGPPFSTWATFSQEKKSFVATPGSQEKIIVWEIDGLNKEPPMRFLDKFPIGSGKVTILKGCRLGRM